jgi:hypothetical protein
MVHTPEKRKGCRKDHVQLLNVRNVIAFWFQPAVLSLHKSALKGIDFDELQAGLNTK